MSRVVADAPCSYGYADLPMMQRNWYKPIPFQQAGEDPSTPYNLPEVSGICVTRINLRRQRHTLPFISSIKWIK
jgi:hypothetical protein